MSHLTALPDELLGEILTYLPHNPHALSLTCRRLHNFTTSYLYGSYSFCRGDATPFIRTLATNERLASHLKTIKWDNSYNDILRNLKTTGTDVATDFELIQAMRSHEQSFIRDNLVELVPDVRSEDEPTVLMVIMALATNLQNLEVADTSRWDLDSPWFEVFAQELCPHPFEHLVAVKLGGPVQITNIVWLLTIPSLRTLEMSRVRNKSSETSLEERIDDICATLNEFLEDGCHIEHLHLYKSCIDLQTLYPIFKAIRGLKSFTYEYTFYFTPESTGMLPNFDVLSSELQCHPDTLTSLRLPYDKSTQLAVDVINFLYKIREFPRLETLDMCPVSVHKEVHRITNALPVNLKTLVLRPWNAVIETEHPDARPTPHAAATDAFLHAVAQGVQEGSYSRLKSIEVRDWHPWFGHYPPSVMQLQSTFAEMGIKLSSIPLDAEAPDEKIEIDDDSEPGWVLVDKLLNSHYFD